MTQANAIIGLLAQTSIHAGAGASSGAVDLPIQREIHNNWPCVFGSSVKGAFRCKAEETLRKETLQVVFGPDTANAPDHGGAICLGDARLLLLPVRSLTTSFKWVTCGEALKRLKLDMELLNIKKEDLQFDPETDQVTDLAEETGAVVHNSHPSDLLILEEYRFTQQPSDLTNIIEVIAAFMHRSDAVKELEERLVIVSNDTFSFLVRNATPVTPHIAIDNTTKTVRRGALWYEETLPPETLLYAPLMAERSRKASDPTTAEDILKFVIDLFKSEENSHPWLRIGGNETVGMGWCGVKVIESGA